MIVVPGTFLPSVNTFLSLPSIYFETLSAPIESEDFSFRITS